MFKVVPDQLRISEGWVRCGQCDEIFDAQAHMQAELLEGLGTEVPDKSGAQAPAPEPVHATSPPADLLDKAPAVAVLAGTKNKRGRTEPVLSAADAPSDHLPDGSAYSASEAPAATQGPTEGIQVLHPTPPEVPASVSQAAELSFMRTARPSTRWHRPLVRAMLMVVFLFLLSALVLQLAVHERDRIAAMEPGLRPYLDEICLAVGCKVGPLRQIESVVIDSSAFSKVRGDVYQLSLTLKNTAPFDLAMPSVELSLTDTLDQALIRRVLRPEDLGVKTGVIRAISETQSTLVLNIKTNGSAERVAGYRLLAFYP